MRLVKFSFDKKCDFDLCQNRACYSLDVGARGNVLICQKCLTKLKQILRNNGEKDEKK